jgi:hypothetical protein
MMVLDQRIGRSAANNNVIIIEELDTEKVKQQLFEAFSL